MTLVQRAELLVVAAAVVVSGCSVPRKYEGKDAASNGDAAAEFDSAGISSSGGQDGDSGGAGSGGRPGTGGSAGGGGGTNGLGGRNQDAGGSTDSGGGGAASSTGAGGTAGQASTGLGGSGGVTASGGSVGSGGSAAGGSGPVACASDEKRCSNGLCVKLTDPAYGCAASSNCVACSLLNVAAAVCQQGACAVGTCSPGFKDCDSQPDCETDIRQTSHCGDCTTRCADATPVCLPSGATYACASGCSGTQVRCGGICTDTTVDVANCNGCGKTCTIANGSPTCSDGRCIPKNCDTGYSACGAVCIYTDGDPQNCGGCNLKCPSGSLCRAGACEVRVGFPNRFTGNEGQPFSPSTGGVTASALVLTKRSTLLALGYINASTTPGAVATFGLYSDDGANAPGALVASAPGVVLGSSVQEIAVPSVVLGPGTYYFAILTNSDGEPKIYTSLSATPTIDTWYGGPAPYANGLPSVFGSLASEVFSGPQYNIYLVVRQPGS